MAQVYQNDDRWAYVLETSRGGILEVIQSTGQSLKMGIMSEEECFFERAAVELRWYLVLRERGDQKQ